MLQVGNLTEVVEDGSAAERPCFGWRALCAQVPCMALVESGGMVLGGNVSLEEALGGALISGTPLEAVLPGLLASLPGVGGAASSVVLQRGDRGAVPVRVAAGLLDEAYGVSSARLIVLMEMETKGCSSDPIRAMHRELLDSAPDAMAITRDGKLIHCNLEFGRMFGYTVEEVAGQVLDDLVIPEGLRHESEILLHTVQTTGRAAIETVRRNRAGEEIEVSVLVTEFKRTGGSNELFVVYRDIRHQKQAEERWRHRALHDVLTGLPNRQLLLERVRQTMARLRRRPDRNFAVMFVDLDHFKQVNDELGHAAGDMLLLEATRRLRSCLRPQDTMARLGGDEFALVLNEVESQAGCGARGGPAAGGDP